MELKLKSLLAAPKLKSGAKALALALSFAALPFWAALMIFLAVYLSPFSFPIFFVPSALASIYALGIISGALGAYWTFLVGLEIFFVLFVVKDYAVSDRSAVFSLLSAAVFSVALFGFFSGSVSLLILFLLAFALSSDILSFYPEKHKHYAISGVFSLVVSEIAWLLNIFAFPLALSILFVFTLSLVSIIALVRHLEGTLFSGRALYFSFAIPVIVSSAVFLALFY